MLPQDGNFTSVGAIKAPDARPERLAFEALLLAHRGARRSAGPHSVFPDALNPALFVNVWSGPPKVETGQAGERLLPRPHRPDASCRTSQRPAGPLSPSRSATVSTLPDGKGSIQLDGWMRWVKLQIGDAPGVPISLGAIGFAVAGLCLSLFVRPRRVWVRVRSGEPWP